VEQGSKLEAGGEGPDALATHSSARHERIFGHTVAIPGDCTLRSLAVSSAQWCTASLTISNGQGGTRTARRQPRISQGWIHVASAPARVTASSRGFARVSIRQPVSSGQIKSRLAEGRARG